MSARPRPVTATFKPESMKPVTGVRTRSYSLSSGSSTASLVSVLDHESCESLGESEDEQQVKEEHVKDLEISKVTISVTETKTDDNTTKQEPELTPYEKWLIEKAKKDRQRKKDEAMKKRREKEEEEEKKRKKKEAEVKGKEKFQEWQEKKNLTLKLRKKQEVQEQETKAQLEEENKRKIEEDQKEKYEQWLKEKKEREKAKKQEEKEKKRKEEEEAEEKRKKCEEAFQEWCKKAQDRPKSARSSFGYTSGKLTGYYDTAASPAPTFYNPIPWHPIDTSKYKEKTKRPRAKTAKSARRRWDPKKYL